jgi:hypothetical protein
MSRLESASIFAEFRWVLLKLMVGESEDHLQTIGSDDKISDFQLK